MNGAVVDALITSFRRTAARKRGAYVPGLRYAQTTAAALRVSDTGGRKPALVLTPDGPCVIEHFDALIGAFSDRFRVVCFDMPGTGFSFPAVVRFEGCGHFADLEQASNYVRHVQQFLLHAG
jgi:hypothetical protein